MALTKLNNQSLSAVTSAGLPTGTVLQVLSTVKTDTFDTNSTMEDVTGLSVTITPSSSSNKILILVDVNSYYSKLLLFLRHVVDEGFLSEDQLSKTKICQNLNEVIIELNKLDVNNAKNIY